MQADISIGGLSNCVGRSAGLSGRYTVREALERLTEGACGFEILDPRTVRLLPRARRAAPAPSPTVEPGKLAEATPFAAAPAPVSEVLITATKRVEAQSRVPASVSVISGEQLAATGAVDATAAVRQAAGVTITNLGAGRDKILLRGLSDGTFTGRTRSTVGTFLDNAPITYNAPDPDLRLADVEAIEIVRGPQGALYGAGSLSGIYRIVTRQPRLGVLEGQLSVLLGWTEGGSQSQQYEGVVNLPVAGDRAAARLVGYYEVQGGYLDDINLRLSNVDKTTRYGGRVALRANLDDNWTATLSGAIQHLDSNDSQYVTTLTGLRRANRTRETHGNDFSEAALTLEGAVPWGRLQSSTAYVRHDFTSQFDATAALSLFGETAADFGLYKEGAKINLLSHDTVLSSSSSGPLRWLVGAYGALTQETSPSSLSTRNTTSNAALRAIYTEHRSDRLSAVALYGEASYDLAPGWTLALGARTFQIDLRTTSNVVAPAPGRSRAFTKKAEFSGWSPKASLQYEFAGGDMVYLLASQGYRPGGFNSGGISQPAASLTVFRPDKLKNYELGTKLNFFDHRLEVRGTVFYDVWTNIQTDQFFNSGLAFTTNVGDGRNTGLEIETAWRPTARWRIEANALFDDPKLTRVSNTFANQKVSLPGVPDVSFGALASYEQPLSRDRSLRWTAEVTYVGRSRITFNAALSPEMGGYFTGRLSTEYRTRLWRAMLAVDNPTNSQGDTFAYGNPFSFGQVRQVTPQRPRTFSLTVTRAF